MARTAASARPLTDHDEIRRWAEERNAKPSCVRRTGGGNDVGMIRLDFPGYSGEGSLEEISWDDWFQKFDESNLALLVQDQTARGQQSNFNKLVSRENAEDSGLNGGHSSRSSGARGSKRSQASSSQSASDEDSDMDEEVDIEEIEMEVTPRRSASRRASSGSRGKRQARTTGSSRSRNGGRKAARKTSSARGQRSRGTTARGTSSQSRSARGTSSQSRSAR